MKKFLLVLALFIPAAFGMSLNDMSPQKANNAVARAVWEALGLEHIPGGDSVSALGIKQGVDTTMEMVWASDGDYTIATAPRVLRVFSSSANDDSGSTGAEQILIKGLDADYEEIEETVTMNGVQTVLTTNSYVFVNSATVVDAGSNLTNVGTINIHQVTDNHVLAVIPAGQGKSQQAFFQVPANKNGILSLLDISIHPQGDPLVHYEVVVHNFSASGNKVLLGGFIDGSIETGKQAKNFSDLKLAPKDIVYVRASSTVVNTKVNALLNVIVEQQ